MKEIIPIPTRKPEVFIINRYGYSYNIHHDSYVMNGDYIDFISDGEIIASFHTDEITVIRTINKY